ncbi:MAG TPA: hypothetical protein VLM75_06670 [Spirochaetota bacterium]|nr:hypothetical protein [Spirochaetota bacterium]
MAGDNKQLGDFDLNSFDIDVDLDNPFADELKAGGVRPEPQHRAAAPPPPPVRTIESVGPRRRSSKDFNPDMDALLLTAQSSMIIEGMQNYTQGNFSSATLPIYMEALKGVALYTKILDRNPNNYNKLKELIDSDTDCKEVETIAFNMYKMMHGIEPDSYQEKLAAFEKFELLFKEAVNKASVSNSMRLLKKYLLMSGSLDEVKIRNCFAANNPDFAADIQNFIQHLKLAHEMVKKGKCEISKGLKGRDINIYIIKTSYLLYSYYSLAGNPDLAEYYGRVHSNYKKYFIIRE